MPNIYELSTTAANNASVAGMNWAEGQQPGTVNNSARQLCALIPQFLGDIGGALEAGGTANALTVTANSDFTEYADGILISFKASADNTAAATLSVNGVGAKAIRKLSAADGEAALDAGDIVNGYTYSLRYSATANSAAGAWLLDWAPKLDTSAFVTLTGTETLTNKTLTAPQINDTTADHQYVFAVSELAADRTVTLPLLTGNDEFVFKAHTQTLTNKTLTSPTISDPTISSGLTASSVTRGIVELATNAEAQTGTDTERAITAANLHAAVGNASAGLSLGAIGTTATLRRSSGAVTSPGDVVAGSALVYASSGGDSSGVSPSGTWRCMGYTASVGAASQTTTWLRIT